jgi:peptidoglycan/xylan/chitin deacetylase (PgdA/CDA1 family)
MRRVIAVIVITVLSLAASPVAMASGAVSTNRAAVKTCNLPAEYVWLTFDDGGPKANVLSILATLRKENVKAIFFPTGVWKKANPGLVKQIVAEGHILGNHTYSHRALSKLGKGAIKREIAKGVESTNSPKLLRPPYGAGAFDMRVQSVAKNMGYQMCFWTVDTRDWAGPSASTIIKRVKRGQKGITQPVKAGGVVLMHMHPKNTSKALPGVIKAVRSKGLELPPLG